MKKPFSYNTVQFFKKNEMVRAYHNFSVSIEIMPPLHWVCLIYYPGYT